MNFLYAQNLFFKFVLYLFIEMYAVSKLLDHLGYLP